MELTFLVGKGAAVLKAGARELAEDPQSFRCVKELGLLLISRLSDGKRVKACRMSALIHVHEAHLFYFCYYFQKMS